MKIDWIIHMVANGLTCAECGKAENPFLVNLCNCHTHGMARYNHLDFQMVLHVSPEEVGYILNAFGKRVQVGEKFKAGDLVDGIFLDCPVRLDLFRECDREVLRVIIPDGQNRFPEDPECTYPYSYQLLPTEALKKGEGSVT